MGDGIKERLSRIEDKLDKTQELIWQHINNDTKKFEQLESKAVELANEQKWFKRIVIGVASVLGTVVSWVIAIKR